MAGTKRTTKQKAEKDQNYVVKREKNNEVRNFR